MKKEINSLFGELEKELQLDEIENLKVHGNSKERAHAYHVNRTNGEFINEYEAKDLIIYVLESKDLNGINYFALFEDGNMEIITSDDKMIYLKKSTYPLLEDLRLQIYNLAQKVVNRIGLYEFPREDTLKNNELRLSFITQQGLHIGKGPASVLKDGELTRKLIKLTNEVIEQIKDISKESINNSNNIYEIEHLGLKIALDTYQENAHKNNLATLSSHIVNGKLLAPATKNRKSVNEDGDEIINGKYSLIKLTDEYKQQYFPLFTDKSEVDKWNTTMNKEIIIQDFDDLVTQLCESTLDVKGITINPFSQNLILDSKQLKDIIDYKLFLDEEERKKRNQNLSINFLEEKHARVKAYKSEPKQLQDIINNYVLYSKYVRKAYLAQIFTDLATSNFLVLDLAKDNEEVIDDIKRVTKPYLKGEPLTIATIKHPLGSEVTTFVEPFYISKSKMPIIEVDDIKGKMSKFKIPLKKSKKY